MKDVIKALEAQRDHATERAERFSKQVGGTDPKSRSGRLSAAWAELAGSINTAIETINTAPASEAKPKGKGGKA